MDLLSPSQEDWLGFKILFVTRCKNLKFCSSKGCSHSVFQNIQLLHSQFLLITVNLNSYSALLSSKVSVFSKIFPYLYLQFCWLSPFLILNCLLVILWHVDLQPWNFRNFLLNTTPSLTFSFLIFYKSAKRSILVQQAPPIEGLGKVNVHRQIT